MVGVWGLIGPDRHVSPLQVGLALILQIFVAVALATSPRWDHRRWSGIVVIVAFLASLALLRAGVGTTAAYGSLVLLPVLWSALRRRRAELLVSIAGAAAVLLIPIVAFGGRYTATDWRSDGLTVIVAAVVGLTVLALVDRQRRDLEQLRALAGGLPHGCFVLFDTDLRYLMAGGSALGQFGQSPADLEGKTIHEAFPPDTAARLETRFRAALAGGEQRWEVTSRGREYDLRAVPVRDGDGHVFAGAVVTVDVTERVQHDAEQRALSRVATLVAKGAKPGAVFQAVAEEIAQLLSATLVGVVRFELATVGGEVDLAGTSAAATVYRTGAPARIEGYPSGPRDPVVEDVALHGAVCAPISVGGVLWGSVGASFTDTPVPADAEIRLIRFAELVSVAVANAEAWDALARQAATDPVTGLANHRAFYEYLRAEVERARRHRGELSVTLFDLDHFKQINDRHGHQTGDKVLAEVALRLSDQVDGNGLLARIGGEEFAWVMPETSDCAALDASDRARHAIAGRPFDGAGELTISAGVCAYAPGQAAEDLALAHAWDAMTEARAYKPTSTRADALAGCTRERGRQFAATAVDALLRLAERGALGPDSRSPKFAVRSSPQADAVATAS